MKYPLPPIKSDTKGFTIVELLIVIVVIAILATVTVVAYAGIQSRASNSARVDELAAWDKQFKLYYAMYGYYPVMPNGGYCLGTGFPNIDGSGLGNCRESNVPGTRYQVSTTLNTELAKVATLPGGPRSIVVSGAGALGPFVEYDSATYLQIKTIIAGPTCPDGTSNAYTYPNNAASVCMITETSDR